MTSKHPPTPTTLPDTIFMYHIKLTKLDIQNSLVFQRGNHRPPLPSLQKFVLSGDNEYWDNFACKTNAHLYSKKNF